MKKVLTFTFFAFLLSNSIFSQNEFGTVGSYWTYDYVPHDGGGSGWTMVTIIQDTTIAGLDYKKYERLHYFQPFGPEEAFTTTNTGLIEIKNDSIFRFGNPILDFDMALTDSLYLQLDIAEIQLAVDSITTETIDGYDYKKWHGQKICINGANGTGPYEPFTILESVGQIESDYLFWNTDNCTIGGGFQNFVCYRNGDFTYPPNSDCVPLVPPVTTKELAVLTGVTISPNPVNDMLFVKSLDTDIDEVIVFNLAGKELARIKGTSNVIEVDTSLLEKGMYLIKISAKNKVRMDKFIKM